MAIPEAYKQVIKITPALLQELDQYEEEDALTLEETGLSPEEFYGGFWDECGPEHELPLPTADDYPDVSGETDYGYFCLYRHNIINSREFRKENSDIYRIIASIIIDGFESVDLLKYREEAEDIFDDYFKKEIYSRVWRHIYRDLNSEERVLLETGPLNSEELKIIYNRFRQQKKRFVNKLFFELGLIYDIEAILNLLRISRKTFEKYFIVYKVKYGKFKKMYYEKKSLYKAISDYSLKYENGIRIFCNYDRLPEYLTEDECAEKLGIKTRKFKSNVNKYLEKDHKLLEGVEILKIGSTERIEKKSFLRYVETLGGETAK